MSRSPHLVAPSSPALDVDTFLRALPPYEAKKRTGLRALQEALASSRGYMEETTIMAPLGMRLSDKVS